MTRAPRSTSISFARKPSRRSQGPRLSSCAADAHGPRRSEPRDASSDQVLNARRKRLFAAEDALCGAMGGVARLAVDASGIYVAFLSWALIQERCAFS